MCGSNATTAHDMLLVESFIPGREFAVEGVLTGGALRLFALFDKPDPLDGPFFEETIYVTPSREPARVQAAIVAAVAAGAARWDCITARSMPNAASTTAGCICSRSRRARLAGSVRKALRFVSPGGEASLEEVLLRHALRRGRHRVYTRTRGVGRDDDSDPASRRLQRRATARS